jgi:hypothetical protein
MKAARFPVEMMALLLTMALLASINSPAEALVVVPPATSDNITAPTDDPGYLNVADNGIYVGDRWVITAAHVEAQTATFPGVGTFNVDPGSRFSRRIRPVLV